MLTRNTPPRQSFLAERKDRYRRAPTGLAGRYAQEAERRDELDRIRIERPLTAAEYAEHDLLAGRLYMREYRRTLALATAAL